MGRTKLRALALAVCATGLVPAEAAASAPRAGAAFSVSSSLDGRTVLPHRIAWIGSTSLAAARVREVAFLIDGTVRWIEHDPPYSYSDDGGYLVTSWLAPGRHAFTVRIRSTDGRTRARTVTAQVRPAKRVPAKLAGAWTRIVQGTPEELGGPPGRYTLRFERRWLQDRAPGRWDPASDAGYGGIVDNDWVPGPRTFEVAGSVTFRVLSDSDAEGGWWCEPGGPKATYAWSVRGDRLTLAPVGGSDPCRERGTVYTGTWSRKR